MSTQPNTPTVAGELETFELKAPAVPVGLSTKLGLGVAAAAGVLSALSVILAGDVTDETIAALVTALGPLLAVIGGRMYQAGAAAAAPPAPMIRQEGPR